MKISASRGQLFNRQQLKALVLLFYFYTAPLFADDDSGDKITSVSVKGLGRTRPFVAERCLKKFIGRETSDFNAKDVEAAVLDTGILEYVSMGVKRGADGSAGGNTLEVTVREKWALFLAPFFYTDFDDDLSAGGAFYDANAFGLNDKMILAGMWQTSGWLVYGMYSHSESGNVPGISVAGNFARSTHEDTDQKDDVLRRFNLNSGFASLSFDYTFFEGLSGRLGISWQGSFLQDGRRRRAPDDDAQLISPGAGITWRRAAYDGFLLSEKRVSLGYDYSIGFGVDNWHTLKAGAVWQQSIVPGFRTDFRASAVYDPDVPVFFENGPVSAAVNILPSTFSARSLAGVSLGLEKYLIKMRLGTISLLTSWQMAYSNGEILGDEFDYGLAASLSFYLSQLAIPAIGIGIAWDIPAEHVQFAFSIGMQL